MARNEVSLTPLSVAVIFVMALAIIPMDAAGEIVVDVSDIFYTSGLMGDWGDISIRDDWTGTYHSAPTSTQIKYSGAVSQSQSWAGIYWQYPRYNWGDSPGLNLEKATKVSFWARGEMGGERAEFMVGGIEGRAYEDSTNPPVSLGTITLEQGWQRYEIPLAGRDLTQVIGGFCWRATKVDNPRGCTIYLDDIRFET